MRDAEEIRALAWPAERLSDALGRLIKAAGLSDATDALPKTPNSGHAEWIVHAAQKAGCEAEPLHTTLGDLPDELKTVYPALLRIGDSGYLAILSVKGKNARVLTPALERKCMPLVAISRILRREAEGFQRDGVSDLLAGVGLTGQKKARAIEQLLNEQLAGIRLSDCWILSSQPGAKPARLLKQAGVIRNSAAMLGAHTAQYLLWMASWGVLGSLSSSGRMDRAWILAWVLLLLTLTPFQVLTTWLQGLFAIGLGGFLKRRLLCGAMKLRPDETRQFGIGSFLGQALEAEAVETLALSGGIAGLLSLVEIVLAMLVLGRFALILSGWTLLTSYAAWRFYCRFDRWTDKRMAMTEDLVEAMVGQRTRLAQMQRSEWHEEEDRALEEYLGVSRSVDHAGAWLIAAIPRGWLLAGLVCLVPSIATKHSIDASFGLTLGGVLLAYSALRKLTASFADIAAALVAFKRIKPLFAAAAREEKTGEMVAAPAAGSRHVMEADRLTYRYRPAGKLAVQGASLSISRGDRILLEGPSGGGKTTFASLLAGMRQPESGLLLAGGLDRDTLGAEGWRKRVASAPQFHESHILTETLAFNLLLARGWPPTRQDMQDAESVCRELGLGDLLDRMPSGLMQMIGEGGWQLSHGEKSRIYIARALLQSADLVILDESFGALDPENARIALETTMQRAQTLLVIAHP